MKRDSDWNSERERLTEIKTRRHKKQGEKGDSEKRKRERETVCVKREREKEGEVQDAKTLICVFRFEV